ncbi:MAG: hypothetical protein U0796_12505 [Gemmatales bacterium]
MKQFVITTACCVLGFGAGLVMGFQWESERLQKHVEAMRLTEPDYRPCGLFWLIPLMIGFFGGFVGMLLGWRVACCFVTDPVLLGDDPETDPEYD